MTGWTDESRRAAAEARKAKHAADAKEGMANDSAFLKNYSAQRGGHAKASDAIAALRASKGQESDGPPAAHQSRIRMRVPLALKLAAGLGFGLLGGVMNLGKHKSR